MPSPKDFRCVQIGLDRSKDDFFIEVCSFASKTILDRTKHFGNVKFCSEKKSIIFESSFEKQLTH